MTRSTVLALALVTGLTLSACGSDDPLDTTDAGSEDTAATGGEAGAVTVGSANFPGNALLAEMYAAVLDDAGVDVSTRLNIGNRETYIAGIEDGSIDLIPEYTGALTLYFNPEAESTDPEGVYSELQEALPEGLTVLEPSDAEDKDAVVVTRETADEYDLTSIADLEPVAGDLVLGGPPEWEERYTGVPGLREVYGLEFSAFRPLAAGSNLTAQSLVNGQIDAANIFTTDPAIPENDFVVLEDPESLFVAQNIVPLVNEDALNDTIAEALNEFSSQLTTEEMTDALSRVVVDGESPADVAREFVDNL
ncbi:ABC transporter substrate-binding protein [Ornithinimicrobium sediminis]|uniref:ABC transporter substrate-binding protein n=1 Tax=Ornithinimicrobium sediminis TaxID=2904603 RepID=UPI001E3509A9|nr:ABC transporter substrate-binding protein [Ornithinimicrobium sediminis]MCE0487521.1 ABC transporter substrate-binding protein [Ornithinimicrobium sediminis]